MPEKSLPFGLKRFKIGPNWPILDVPAYTFVARTADLAWAKFCRQRFGLLKPCRQEWYVTETDGGK